MFGLPGAALMTGVLLLVMAAMIGQPPVIDTAVDAPVIEILAKPEPEQQPIAPPRRVVLTEPEPPVIERGEKSENPGNVFELGRPEPIGGAGGKTTPIDINGPAIKPPPPYPEACASRGAEGVVVVEYDVTDRGEVVNIRIISSPDRCFDSAVRRAVQNYKYSPLMVDGKAIAQKNIRESIRFEIEE